MSGNKICDNESKMQEILGNFQLPKPYKRNWGNFRIKGNVVEYVTNSTPIGLATLENASKM